MEAPHLMENGNTSQRRKWCKVALYTSIFVLIVISFLVSTIFYLLHDKQPQETCWAHGFLKRYNPTSNRGTMIWEWSFKHCHGLVKDHNEYLIIMEDGNYFIYAQINRETETEESFTLALYKEPGITLNEAVGPNKGGNNGTVNFGRPFYLRKGDELRCELNVNSGKILLGYQSYWGLYKI
uniref:THD domain-containing protein n=1 Tax=Phasianus colchicus TaxID=9054 RepID=A0A669PU74_PHACC